ncbi:type VI secretion system contractile sheath small subunit [Citrobacter sp. FP75]|uniref:type VI secretion system contractile sheath small subunit n=1 Tax=Citrobacter sp. FP75 TaxID=1852949 RepID=UPI001BC92514|nr:type VI secretion system contractile sheath small subunit [Citrobacter sp. FP75]
MSSSKSDGSVAPKERINVRYTPKTNGEVSEVELPLNMLIVGDTGKIDDTPLDERSTVSINKNNFNSVIAEAGISLNFNVPNLLNNKADEEINVHMDINALDDFSPDNIARQVPEMKRLLELREALVALKGPMGNLPAFRAQIQALLDDENSREQLLNELGVMNKD